MEKFNAFEIFTPTQPAIKNFVERAHVNIQLSEALMTPGKQIILYGHSGSGKSTLIENKLNSYIANSIVSRCVSETTFANLILDALDQLEIYYASELSTHRSRIIAPEISALYFKIKSSLTKSDDQKFKKLVDVQLTPQRLASFLGEASCCWILEDFHKANDPEKRKLSEVMKIFMDNSISYNNLKIIAIGAVDSAREIVDINPEMKNRVSEIYVPLMKDSELRKIIENGESALNVKFNEAIKSNIVKFSCGLPATCHQICLSLCFVANIYHTTKKTYEFTYNDFKNAVNKYVLEYSDTLRKIFSTVLNLEQKLDYEINCSIIKTLLKSNEEEVSLYKIREDVQKNGINSGDNVLVLKLKNMCSSKCYEVLRKSSNSDAYSFSNPLYKAYAHCIFDDQILITELPFNIRKGEDASMFVSRIVKKMIGLDGKIVK